jgi:4-hydroxyacetophenone monooxygenase
VSNNADSIKPLENITEDDDFLVEVLKEANIPALMAALVHLTGSVDIIRREIKPNAELFGDPQGGISEQDQETVREVALGVLKGFRDSKGKLPPVPDAKVIKELLDFVLGAEVPDEYLEFLSSELSLHGEDAYEQPAIREISQETKSAFKVIIIGSGMSGILAGIKLQEAGIPFDIIEKNADVGGTWLENTYPGCRVDSANHTYSYSFAPKDWPQHYSPQKVLLDYFDQTATKYDLRKNIKLNMEVQSLEFQQASGMWKVKTKSGEGVEETLLANAVITAVGQLNRPKYPDIEGVGTFNGPAFHSGRWEEQRSLEGKRIGVIGTGASAFQFIPEIAKEAQDIVVFQRTPPWIAPREEYHDDIPKGKHWLLNKVPFYEKWFRFLTFWRASEGLLDSVRKDEGWQSELSVGEKNDQLRQMLTDYIESMVGDDPDLFDKALPKYPPAGKRMLVDNGTWLTALKRPNVHIIIDPIAEINSQGLKTESGDQYDVDVLIYGTGFKADQFLAPIEIRGVDGVELQAHWNGDPRAYLGVTMPKFPNLFCMYGPNTNIVVNGSIIFFSECEMRYILGCFALMLKEGKNTLEVKQSVHDAYNELIDEGNLNMAWGAPNVRSWYKNKSGRVTQNWPFTMREFWERTRSPDPEDFELTVSK